MINFTAFEYLNGIILSAIFGMLCAIIYLVLFKIPINFKKLLRSFKYTVSKDNILIGLREMFCKTENDYKVTSLKTEILSFIHVIACGILYCIVLYISFDGIFRIISLLTVLLMFFVFKKLISGIESKTLDVVYLYLIYTIILFLRLIIAPLVILYVRLYNTHIFPKLEKNRLKRCLKLHKKVQNKKYKEIIEFIG